MDIGDLPEAMQEDIISLKHGSATIEADVLQALDEAEDLHEFQESVKTAMINLKGEIEAVLKLF
ncbi:MAG: hypothetical protein SCH70_04340 [Candidatus Methanoperedens sp.]|nr:hypothetical protein [Candidatus Methanoperedens sp.]